MTYSSPNRAGLRQRLAEFKEVLNRLPEGSIERGPVSAGIEPGKGAERGCEVQEAAPHRAQSACETLALRSTRLVAPASEKRGTLAAGVDDRRSPRT
jgi:hypothetical protein